ncbi:3-dehydroquinate synthase [hydrothermal vent metagenome]|uniref:3-dehydroquinate synthase n=1 Tax=hydrothermal vent metagenome TaxID=652676 RepID=A0A3B0R7G3_9ZZZZ
MEKIHISLTPQSRNYDVMVGAGALVHCAQKIATFCPRKILPVITDETVASLHLDKLENALAAVGVETRALILPPGEANKSFAQLETVCNFLLEQEMERSDCLAAFGGGVVGDLAGLASALLKRGTGCIQIPTTLLAQVDSSVGGKTAINAKAGKNMIGVFHQPKLVVADLDFLRTLDARQWRAGYAEILKMACLADAAFFHQLQQNGPELATGKTELLAKTIGRAVQGKADIVAKDEREQGVRALLNLGHTFAHALEAEAPGKILHGEAVAAGLAAAFSFSAQLGLCSASACDLVLAHLRQMGLPASLAEAPGGPFCAAALLARMKQDKKNRQGLIHLVLCRNIGTAFVTAEIEEQKILQFMKANLR